VIGNDAPNFGRLVTAMVTPFDDNLQIDFPALDRIVDHLLSTGTTAIVVAGTTGESPTLENDEKKVLLSHVIKRAKGKAKIIMGTGSNSTTHSIEATRQAEDLGADAALVVAPYYNKPNQSGLLHHFISIAGATKLPVMVYNIPGRTGVNVDVDTIVSLAQKSSNVRFLKDSTGGPDQTAEIARRAPADFRIYSGDDYLTLPFMSVGGCGIVSVASHVVGDRISEMMQSFLSGNLDKARSLHYELLSVFKGLFAAPNPTCVKYALSRLNLCKPNLRAPLVQLSDEQKSTLEAILLDTKISTVAKFS
jgi:4-hydroxy-tetrahydrodipicolinate synthase